MTTLPPGPRFALPTLLRYVADPYGATLGLFERYGDPHTVHYMGDPVVETGDPQLIRAILAADPDSYEVWGVDLLSPALGKESLLMLAGDRHRAARKLLMPPFAAARMRAYGRAMQAIARDEARRWSRASPFSMSASTQAISMRIILQAVFGLTDPEKSARFEAAIVSGIEAITPSLLFFKVLQHEFGGIGPWARLQRRTRALEEIVYAELASRRADAAEREDILSLVMAARYDDGSPMTDRQLFETLMTIVIAGHETSAIAAAWACYLVHRAPAVRERLFAELATLPEAAEPDAIASLPYLGAVCDEALRLKPVAASIMRKLKRPMRLGEWELPAGVTLQASIVGLHHRPDLYPEPAAFRPERFLERAFAPYEYLPFGGGHRRCIGAAFASYELKILLATVLRERPLRLVSDLPIGVRLRNTVAGPRIPIEFSLA